MRIVKINNISYKTISLFQKVRLVLFIQIFIERIFMVNFVFNLLFILIFLFSCQNQDKNIDIANLSTKPNILFIISDDQAFDGVGSLGNKDVQTPNLDALVRTGTTFTHTYNMGGWGAAICIASRSMLNSGKFLKNAKKFNFRKNNNSSWSMRMQAAGYKTYFTGKWHVPIKPTKIFDVVSYPRGGMPSQTKIRYKRNFEGKETWSPWDKSKGGYWKGEKHWSEVVADSAISFLNEAKSSSQPFFMYIAFNAPHDPRQSPKKYVDKYPLDKIKLPKSFIPDYPYRKEIGMVNYYKKNKTFRELRDERLAPHPRTERAVKINIQEYYAIITHMDYQIGRILEALKKSKLGSNTYVIFTSCITHKKKTFNSKS